MAKQDFRARLQPKDPDKALTILGPKTPENLLFPLHSTRGVLFPYTPTVTTGNVAEYSSFPFVHTIYSYNAYVRSYPKSISINADFTAQTNDEALYLLAVLHFFKSVTKSYFGINPYKLAGTPPPVLLFNYLGEYQFSNVPVIVKSMDLTYDPNVDYVPVYTSSPTGYSPNIGVSRPGPYYDGFSYVPAFVTLNIELDTQYVPIDLRNEFDLDKFRDGTLVGRGYL